VYIEGRAIGAETGFFEGGLILGKLRLALFFYPCYHFKVIPEYKYHFAMVVNNAQSNQRFM